MTTNHTKTTHTKTTHTKTTHTKTILITGATSGIGRHAALHLAKLGHTVFASGRRQPLLDSLVAEAGDLNVHGVQLDVTDDESIAAARAAIETRTGGQGIDVLINNAGYGHLAPTELVSDADMRKQFDTNVFGLMAVTRAFLPELKRRGGRILNVSSVGGRLVFPLFGVYNATKYAVEALSDALRLELKPFGVDVVLIEPGVIDTGFADVSMNIAERYTGNGKDYAPILAQADTLREQSDKMAVGPIVISKAMEHAITSSRPRARYVAPLRARAMLALADTLPTSLVDWVMRASLGLTRKKLLGRSAAATA